MARRYVLRKRVVQTDEYGSKTLAAILLIVLLSVMDAVLTLDLVSCGAVELNPIMAYYLDHGPLLFFLTKYLLTFASILIILYNQSAYLLGSKVQGKLFFLLFIIAFSLVINWELYLIASINE